MLLCKIYFIFLIFNMTIGAITDNWMMTISSLLGVGMFYIMFFLKDIKEALEKK